MPTPAFLAIEFSDAVLEAVRASWATSRIRSRFWRAFERSGSAGVRSTPSSLIDVVRSWVALVKRRLLRYSGRAYRSVLRSERSPVRGRSYVELRRERFYGTRSARLRLHLARRSAGACTDAGAHRPRCRRRR